MRDLGLSSVLRPGEFLVCYDYGTAGLWGVLLAPSASAITARYPELVVVEAKPRWMSQQELRDLRETPLWLDDDPPQGLLRAVIADRARE